MKNSLSRQGTWGLIPSTKTKPNQPPKQMNTKKNLSHPREMELSAFAPRWPECSRSRSQSGHRENINKTGNTGARLETTLYCCRGMLLLFWKEALNTLKGSLQFQTLQIKRVTNKVLYLRTTAHRKPDYRLQRSPSWAFGIVLGFLTLQCRQIDVNTCQGYDPARSTAVKAHSSFPKFIRTCKAAFKALFLPPL